MRFIGRREGVEPGLIELMDWAEDDDRRKRADHALRRLQLRRQGGDRRRGAKLQRRVRGGVSRPPLRARDARARPPDPNQRRAADLELPALAVRLLRARLQRRALAGFRSRRVRGRAGRVRDPPAPLRGPVAMEGSRPFDSELDFDHPRRNRTEPPPPLAAEAPPRRRRRHRRRAEAARGSRRSARVRRPSRGSPGRCLGSRSWSRSRSSAASFSPPR